MDDRQLEDFSTTYLNYLLASDRVSINRLVQEKIQNNTAPEKIYQGVEKAMYQIGKLWQTNQITIADEHLATAIASENIMYTYQYIVNNQSKNGHVVSFAVENELHDLGIKMINHMFEYHGFNVTYLGNNLPVREAISFLKQNVPDYIAISVTIYTHIQFAKKLIDQMKLEEKLKDCKVIIGGYCFKENQSLLNLVKYDYYFENINGLLKEIQHL